MELLHIIRFGYGLVIATLILMLWVSLNGAREVELHRYPPCYFNPLCSCSKGVPDLGIVKCHDIHLSRIPEIINTSKVFMLHLENNGLRIIEPYFLQSTGLYRLVISKNPLLLITDEAFLGLERSLWELDLSHNQLAYVPNRALRYLQRIRLLDLSGNEIERISPDNWRGIENSLTHLILSENFITYLPMDSFSGLPLLETLDLRGNNLREIDPSVFRDGMSKLTHLLLSDNQLSTIPYQTLYPLKMLKTLDLSYNLIKHLQPFSDGGQILNLNFQLNLNDLKLEYNQITKLETGAFQYFNFLNKTFIDGNPLILIEENAFRPAKIRELYMRNCGLTKISPLAFGGLENYLEVLDMSENNLKTLPDEILNNLQALQALLLRENTVTNLNPLKDFNGFHYSLYKLDLSGSETNPIVVQELKRLKNLRTLSMSKLSDKTLSPENFIEFGIDLEELEITFSGLQTIKNNAFMYIHGLRRLDFLENSIGTIEDDAFGEIEHSLKSLRMSHSLSTSLQTLPDAIKTLSNLEDLDLSNNKLKTMPETSFHFMKKLQRLYLQDNILETIQKGTFQGDIHYELEEIYLSFNNIKSINQHTFVDLVKLEQIHLDDNRIDRLERRSFMNLEALKRLNLKGNKITSISYETFQNLPELEDLDVSYNKLSSLDFTMFDQVGTLSMFHVNISHNSLRELNNAAVSFEPQLVCMYCPGSGSLHSNIKVLDLSHNNITLISKQFFKPVELSLTQFYLHHNNILNATKDIFGNMPHLQVLDVSHNKLYEMDFDTFRNTKKLQILYASNNRLADIPSDLFKFLGYLRVVDFSHNRLRSLPDNLFREGSLEKLDLSHNMLGKLPLNSLSVSSAITLCELDLSWNSISSLAHGGMLTRFKSLSVINLSYNRLAQIDAGTFREIPRLFHLDLGHNSQLALEINGLSFQGLEYSLLSLNLDNVSLTYVPILPTPNLLSLSLAYNALPTIPPEMAANLTLLRKFDLSYNDLTAVPIVTHSLPELRYLNMAANPITVISNTSLLGVADHLIELDLRNVVLSTFETGALCKMYALKTFKINLYKYVKSFNIPRIIQFNNNLENLVIHVPKDMENIDDEMFGEFPVKLRNITFTGRGLKKIGPTILQGVRSPRLHFCLRNTSVMKVPSSLFENLGKVRNLSVDVRNNYVLKTLQNPSTGTRPNMPRRTFLNDLSLSRNKWTCDCDLGWVEVWQRKRRQYLCPASPSITPSLHNFNYKCRHADDDLRITLCENKNNQSLVEVLKTDIECGWSSASKLLHNFKVVLFVVIIGSFLVF